MAVPKIDKLLNVTAVRDDGETAPARRPNPAPAFNFAADDDSGPELKILGASKKAACPIQAMSGVDLSYTNLRGF